MYKLAIRRVQRNIGVCATDQTGAGHRCYINAIYIYAKAAHGTTAQAARWPAREGLTVESQRAVEVRRARVARLPFYQAHY